VNTICIRMFTPLILACFLLTAASAEEFSAKDVLISLDISEKDIKKLEDGEVVTFSGEDYEQSKRELASDATVLINKSLDTVLTEINEQASLIPRSVTQGYQDINNEADFAGVGFNSTSDREFKEVELLHNLKKGKDYNLTAEEYATLTASLVATQSGTREEKTEAASKAVRELLLGRYRAYVGNGLAGIEPYLRGKKSVNISNELKVTTETLDVVEDLMPDYYYSLLNYPDGADCCQQRFRWIKVKLMKRPAFGLTHSTVYKSDDILIITERHFYVTHSLNTMQITVAWLPYEEGTYMGLAMSAQANALDTFMGRVFRGIGRNMAEEMVGDVLVGIRSELEGQEAAEGESMDFIKKDDVPAETSAQPEAEVVAAEAIEVVDAESAEVVEVVETEATKQQD
jgi:hypothetical protein